MNTRPYDFGDLTAPVTTPAAAAALTVADIEAARESAFRDGYEAARREYETQDRETLAAIAEAVVGFRDEFVSSLTAQCAEARGAAADFCRTFAGSIAEEREVEAALSLLDRVLEASVDRSHLTLSLSASSVRKWRERLIVAIRKRGAETFTSLESDADLSPGECRLSWRGGSAVRLLEPALREIDAMIARTAPKAEM